MTGTAKKLIDRLLDEKAKGDKVLENGIRVKLMLKGIRVEKWTSGSEDDPVVIDKIKGVLLEFGVNA
jgi:hypothetical protein